MKFKILSYLAIGYGVTFTGCGLEKHNPWRRGDADRVRLGSLWNLHQESPKKIHAQVDVAPDCGAVETFVKNRLILEMESTIRNNHRWMVDGHWNDGKMPKGNLPSEQHSELPTAEAAPSVQNSAPTSFTDTNNQTEGIEEPDTLKSDGTYFYHLTGNHLRISKVWPITEFTALSDYTFEKVPQQMLLTPDKKLLVFQVPDAIEDGVASFSKVGVQGFLPRYEEKTIVTTMDVADPTEPVVLETKTLEGSLNGARRVGDKVRFVLSRSLNMPLGVKLYFEQELTGKSLQSKMTIIDDTIQQNSRLINEASFGELIHSTRTGLPLVAAECQTILLPSMTTPLGVTDIYSSDLTTGEESVVSLLSKSDGIHGAKDALYVSTQYHWWDFQSRGTNYFYVHKFSYDGIQAAYRGTAGMEGNILNQFSMDEFEGNFRVAATVRQKSDPESWEELVFNRIYVVKDYDGYLAVAGMSEPLAETEQIFGVRFAEKLGYLVTFRRTDPLFVIGFDDPVHPVVLGELKIPGYSTYLHPMGNGQLLAVGEEIDESSQMSVGNKISVYDVSNPTHPTEKFKKVLSPDLYIESVRNHKGFKYHAPSKTLALPSYGESVSDPESRRFGVRAVYEYAYGISLFRIDQEAGIVDAGFLDMTRRGPSASDPRYAGTPHAVIADDIIYGVDSLGIKAAKLAAPSGHYWDLYY